MPAVAQSGSDSLIINNRIISDLADGEIVSFTFPNELATVKTGKNENSIFANNATGRQFEMVIRMVRASGDDKFLNNLMAQQLNNFAGFPLMTGEYTKVIGDGKGNIIKDTYILSGVVFFKSVEAKTNIEGDIDSSIAIYSLRGAAAPRVIG